MSEAFILRLTAEIENKRGLHARASAKFVATVARFNCEIMVRKDDVTVSGRSIMGLMMLGASQGTTIELMATGPEANDGIKAVQALIAAKFHEDS